MASVLSGDRQRLTELMEESCANQDLTWEQVAQRAGRSVALLRNIRKGRAPLTRKSKRAIERGLSWPEGTVDAVLANDQQVIAALRRGELAPVAPATESTQSDDEADDPASVTALRPSMVRTADFWVELRETVGDEVTDALWAEYQAKKKLERELRRLRRAAEQEEVAAHSDDPPAHR